MATRISTRWPIVLHGKGWLSIIDSRKHLAVTVPDGDLVEHDPDSPECVCGPSVSVLESDDGDYAEIVHHALDGRD